MSDQEEQDDRTRRIGVCRCEGSVYRIDRSKKVNEVGVCRCEEKDPCVGSTEEQEELVCRVKDWIVCRSVCVTQFNQ